MGIADPLKFDKIFQDAKKFKDDGYISRNTVGEGLFHLKPDAKKPDY